jgi:hypothetical protein
MYTLNLHKTNDALKDVSADINDKLENFIEHFQPNENNSLEPNYQNCTTCGEQKTYAEHYEPNYDENINNYNIKHDEDRIEHFEQDLHKRNNVVFEGFERY